MVMGLYSDLLRAGWRMHEIDGMDMIGFFKVRSWELNRNSSRSAAKFNTPDGKVYIDDF